MFASLKLTHFNEFAITETLATPSKKIEETKEIFQHHGAVLKHQI